jgi:hypothetical protein
MSNEQPATALRIDGEAPPTYLGWAIASTALCFLPFGLVAASFGWRSAKATANGDDARAARFSKVARRWIIAAVVTGVLLDLVIVVALGLLGAFPAAGPQ